MSQSRWIVCGAFVMLFATLGNSPVAGGAGRADAAAVAAPRAGAQASGAAIAWRACGNRLQCARVRVPLDWSRATVRAGRVVSAGPTISLAVIRYRTRDRRRRIGSLFMNFGGPGVAGTPNVRAAGAAFDGLAGGRFDIVGWDPRGTGASTHVRCFADKRSMLRFWGPDWSIPTTPAAVPALRAQDGQAMRGAARRAAAACWRTSRPRTRSAIWTTCGAWSATGVCITAVSRMARSSARPTPTCSRGGWGGWSWMR